MIEILVQVAQKWVKPKETKVYSRGIKREKATTMGNWAKGWIEQNRRLAKEKEHSEIIMKVTLMLRSVSMALLGFYNPEILEKCEPAVVDSLTSIKTGFHPDFKDLVKPSVPSLLKSWVTNPEDVHRVPIWLRERAPGCVAIGFCADHVLDDEDLRQALLMDDEKKPQTKKRPTDSKTKPQATKRRRIEDDDDSE
jgi:hypothetical protein